MYVYMCMKVDLQVFMCITCIQGPVEARFSQSKVTGGYEPQHKIWELKPALIIVESSFLTLTLRSLILKLKMT